MGSPAATPSSPQPIFKPSPKTRIAAGTATLTVPGRSAVPRAWRQPLTLPGLLEPATAGAESTDRQAFDGYFFALPVRPVERRGVRRAA